MYILNTVYDIFFGIIIGQSFSNSIIRYFCLAAYCEMVCKPGYIGQHK